MSIKIAKKLWLISKKTSIHNLDKKHSLIVNSAKSFEFDELLKSLGIGKIKMTLKPLFNLIFIVSNHLAI